MVQPVSMFSISVEISETVPLTTVRALGLDTEQTSVAGPIALQGITTVRSLPNTAEVTYRPTPNQQRLISPFGLNGKFVIEYDVLRDTRSQMVIENNYFAHFITSNLPVMRKRVVFLIDVSGSMYGYKIAQVRQAMNTILNGLAERDSFSVIAFNSSVTRWEVSNIAADSIVLLTD
uniref:VWFA domain-containing protein n=1 Tax=Ciona savignyi TaxID=51511 RepID=H2ZHS5_CIOSA